tara:strand:+ start:143 stop:1663 length:1521 start_codon:yes stop_codon:yes gene_type:complete
MTNSKLIAKNTIFLYFRMMLTMAVSLYTSRVILNVLGIQDYGIYTVVGGIVAMFGFFNSAMSSATQRYLAIEIGKAKEGNVSKIFNSSFIIHLGIALLVLIFAETIGLWFLNNKLQIPVGRLNQANFVYQFSIIASIITISQVPFNSLILAKERMNIFAIISVVEVILKLLIVYFLYISPFDKLKTYSFLVVIVSLIISSIYKVYCLKNFKESKFKIYKDRVFFIELLKYSGWNLFGNFAAISKQQGINVLLNIFFGSVLNATFGVMLQVQNAVGSFVQNFQTAINPQIYKNYAQGNFSRVETLIFQSSRFSFFLLLILISPIIFNIKFLLNWWLKNPPEYSDIFVTLILINLLIECISYPLITAALATGKIKNYQIVVGTILFLNLPISYIFFKYFDNPVIFLYVAIVLSLVSLCFRAFFLRSLINFRVFYFLKNSIFPMLFLFSINSIFFLFLKRYIILSNNFLDMINSSIMISFVNLISIYLIGINRFEKEMIKSFIIKKIKG